MLSRLRLLTTGTSSTTKSERRSKRLFEQAVKLIELAVNVADDGDRSGDPASEIHRSFRRDAGFQRSFRARAVPVIGDTKWSPKRERQFAPASKSRKAPANSPRAYGSKRDPRQEVTSGTGTKRASGARRLPSS